MVKQTDTREKLLNTAIELIAQSNYNKVGVNEICTKAGVTKGSFYHYYETKADLYYAACLHHWQKIQAQLDAIFDDKFSPLQQLQNMLGMVLEHCQAKQASGAQVIGCPVFTSGAQSDCDDDKVRLVAQEMADNSIAYQVALVRRLKAAKLLNGNPNPQQLGAMLYQYIHGLLMFGRIYNDIEQVSANLKEGVYRLIDLKAAYRS